MAGNFKWIAKNLIEVTAKHWHPSPACTNGYHDSSCSDFGRMTRCIEVWKTLPDMETVSLGCFCEHHVGPDLSKLIIIDEKN